MFGKKLSHTDTTLTFGTTSKHHQPHHPMVLMMMVIMVMVIVMVMVMVVVMMMVIVVMIVMVMVTMMVMVVVVASWECDTWCVASAHGSRYCIVFTFRGAGS